MGLRLAICPLITNRVKAGGRDQGRHGPFRPHVEVCGGQGPDGHWREEGRGAGVLPGHGRKDAVAGEAKMSDLENGFDAKAVKYFFAHWNTSTDEKIRLRAWMAPILNNEILSHDVLAGYTIKGASSFVGEGAVSET